MTTYWVSDTRHAVRRPVRKTNSWNESGIYKVTASATTNYRSFISVDRQACAHCNRNHPVMFWKQTKLSFFACVCVCKLKLIGREIHKQTTYVKSRAQFKRDQKIMFIYPLNLIDNFSLLRTHVLETEGWDFATVYNRGHMSYEKSWIFKIWKIINKP